MFATLGLIAGLGLGLSKPQPIEHLQLYRDLVRSDRGRISVWMDRSSPYDRGDRARVYVSADHDQYLTVLRIDTDGRVRILFPQDPWDDNLIPGGRTFEVEDRDGGRAFRVDDAPGEGYVFAIASDERFDYSSILTQRDHWDYRTIADGQVRGDPYVAVTDLAERIVADSENYDYDFAQYDVERHYDYPRFVCYDCHAYVPYYTWDPYGHSCVRFRVVIYDDPYYYPYRYYGGRRVVTVRPRRAEPRYVFVDNNGGNYITRIPTRPRREDEGTPGGGSDQMRPRRGEDVGGRGTIPVPGTDGRRIIRDPNGNPGNPGTPGDPGTRGRPDRPGRDRNDPPGQERRDENRGGDKPQPPGQDRRDRPRQGQDPPGLFPQPRAQDDGSTRDQPRREEPRREEPRRNEPRQERGGEPRAQPQKPPREERPRSEPRRESGGGGRSSSPELRRRRG